MEPYNFKKIIFNNGFLEKSVDVTYIIHLEGNGRYSDIQKQLSEYHPTNIVYILFNKGYKKSNKKLFIDKPPLDLVDAFLEVFKHADIKNYNNILILEDDFIFSKKMKEINHQNNVNNIISKLNNKNFLYYLGCLPGLMIPYDFYNYKIYRSAGTHAVIYSKKNRIETLKIDQPTIKDWDHFNGKGFRLTYYTPLCYQLFPHTDNSDYWGSQDDSISHKNGIKLFKYTLKLYGLDKKVEPGTSLYYYIAKFSFYIIFIIFFIFIFIIYQLIQKKVKIL
jgi:hypothetical protein